MEQCPKCNCKNIYGPTYSINPFGYERLNYRCNRCGYISSTPTKDAKSKPSLLQKLKELQHD